MPWKKGEAATMRKVTTSAINLDKIPDNKPHPKLSHKKRRATWRPDWKRPNLTDGEIRKIVRRVMKTGLLGYEMIAEYQRVIREVREKSGFSKFCTGWSK